MLRIAICDDNRIICEQLEGIIHDVSAKFGENIETDIFFTCESLYASLKNGAYVDVIFLDIEFDTVNGIELSRKIREELQDENIRIIFVSGRESYAMELFESRPFNFLIKPVDEAKIEESIRKIIELSGDNDRIFMYRSGHSIKKVPVNEILYLESVGKKIRLIKTKEMTEFYGKLADAEKQLKKFNFTFTHKSFLINFMHVAEYSFDFVKMTDGREIPVSQKFRKDLRAKLLAYKGWGIRI